MSFAEVLLDLGWDLGDAVGQGAAGGPRFATDVVIHGGGHETRNALWAGGRGRWDVGQRVVSRADHDYLYEFFRSRRGREQGFRLRVPQDYLAAAEPLAPDGTPTLQLTRTYTDAGGTEVRDITKPVAGTVTYQRGGAAFAGAAESTTTGVVTLTPDWTATITGATAAAPAVLSITGHGRTTGDIIYVTATGMAAIDAQAWPVTVIDPNTLSLDGSDTTGQTFDGSGTAAQYVQPSETLTWSGEFDVPVRFDSDEWTSRFDAIDEDTGEALFFVAALPVVELRP